MALKSDRHELQTDISFFMNEVKNRGHVVCHSGSGASGAALDNRSTLTKLVSISTGIRTKSRRAVRLLFSVRVGL